MSSIIHTDEGAQGNGKYVRHGCYMNLRPLRHRGLRSNFTGGQHAPRSSFRAHAQKGRRDTPTHQLSTALVVLCFPGRPFRRGDLDRNNQSDRYFRIGPKGPSNHTRDRSYGIRYLASKNHRSYIPIATMPDIIAITLCSIIHASEGAHKCPRFSSIRRSSISPAL